MRTFIALDPDKDALEKISDIQKNLKKNLTLFAPNKIGLLKWEDHRKFHMTLLFIGETEKNLANRIDEKLSHIAGKYNGMTLEFESRYVNAFPNLKYPRVLVLEMIEETGMLAELAENLRAAMKMPGIGDEKPFRPHITLARVRRDSKLTLAGADLSYDSQVRFRAGALRFYESKLKPSGSEYTILKEYRFDK